MDLLKLERELKKNELALKNIMDIESKSKRFHELLLQRTLLKDEIIVELKKIIFDLADRR